MTKSASLVRLAVFSSCLVLASPAATSGCEVVENGLHWAAARAAMWDAVESRTLRESLVRRLAGAQDKPTSCPMGMATAVLLLMARAAAEGEAAGVSDAALSTAEAALLGTPLVDAMSSGFPVFGALAWLLPAAPQWAEPVEGCGDSASRTFRVVLAHHLSESEPPPASAALDYLGSASSCMEGRATALLSLALAYAGDAAGEEALQQVWELVALAEDTLRAGEQPSGLADVGRGWPIWTLLHRISLALSLPTAVETKAPQGCFIMIYAYPTAEIKADTVKALEALEKYYLAHLGVTYPLVVFTDPRTASTLEEDLGGFTSARVVPAVIPEEALHRDVQAYSCVDGVDCISGQAPASDAHRGVVNGSQFWSADYLRISRYTAGPLFGHEALDECGAFLKIDTDFYFTSPVESDPIEEMAREGSRLGYWQIHVQGQRQEGYQNAAVEFLRDRGLPILNQAFYARGRFEERALKLGIPISEVPEALEASTLIYGCLFAGDVRFFREPLYRDFFGFMDAQRGFETRGWSNQFFLGTAAAAFLFPSQVRRLYLSGKHQDSQIEVSSGEVTEFLEGSTRSAFR